MKNENIGKLAFNENKVLGLITDVTVLGASQVYIGIPFTDSPSWLSISPEVLKEQVFPSSLIEMAMFLAPTPKVDLTTGKAPPKDKNTTFFTVVPGDSLGETLDKFLNNPFTDPRKPPNAEDFRIDSLDDPDEDQEG